MKEVGSDGWQLPTEKEVEVANILANFTKLHQKFEFRKRNSFSFSWGKKKKRSVLESPEIKENSPSTPLCFLPSKPKETEDLMEIYSSRREQEKDVINNVFDQKLKAVETFHQEATYENLELEGKGKKINYSRNYHIWDTTMMKTSDQQINMFAPSTSQQHCNINYGGTFGLFNRIEPRVKTYDFMGLSRPLDRSKYLMMESDLSVSAGAAARKRRRMILRMKQDKNSFLAMKMKLST